VKGDNISVKGPSLYAAEEAALKRKHLLIRSGKPIPPPTRRELRYDLNIIEPTKVPLIIMFDSVLIVNEYLVLLSHKSMR
jgi:hypothetical protein